MPSVAMSLAFHDVLILMLSELGQSMVNRSCKPGEGVGVDRAVRAGCPFWIVADGGVSAGKDPAGRAGATNV